MKILLVSQVFPPSIGGVERIGCALAEGLAARGHSVTVYTPQRAHAELDNGFRRIESGAVGGIRPLLRSADVVFWNHLWMAPVLGAIGLSTPQALLIHTEIPLGGWKGKLRRWHMSRCRCAAVSHFLASRIPLAVDVIPNGIVLTGVEASIKREFDYVYLGRLVSDKGAELFLNALARLPESLPRRTLVLGDGPERAFLERRVTELGLRSEILFRGSVPPADARRGLRQARVCVIPSRWEEPFGLVALEALDAGCAVVASQRGGLPEAVGSCGVRVDPENASAMAEAMSAAHNGWSESLAGDPTRLAHLKRFSSEEHIGHVEAWLLQTMENRL